MTESAAAALIVIDETESATLSEIALASHRSVSTVQRTVDRLLETGVLDRPAARGPVRFAAAAPRSALRTLAEWRLGTGGVAELLRRIRRTESTATFHAPPSIRDDAVRRAWPAAIQSIVSVFDPAQVVLFGSQARGDARPDSDVDLLVVFDEVDDRRERRVQLRRLLNHQPFAKDVLVANGADVAHPPFGSALAEALREGVTVYER